MIDAVFTWEPLQALIKTQLLLSMMSVWPGTDEDTMKGWNISTQTGLHLRKDRNISSTDIITTTMATIISQSLLKSSNLKLYLITTPEEKSNYSKFTQTRSMIPSESRSPIWIQVITLWSSKTQRILVICQVAVAMVEQQPANFTAV